MAGFDRGGSLLRFVAKFNGWAIWVVECTKASGGVEVGGEGETPRVAVSDPGNQLYNMGYFGKGTLSRSQPMYNRVNTSKRKRNFNDKPNKRMRSFHLKHTTTPAPTSTPASSSSIVTPLTSSSSSTDNEAPKSAEVVEEGEKTDVGEESSASAVVEEFLQLGYEEAFYLAFELNVLDIIDEVCCRSYTNMLIVDNTNTDNKRKITS